MPMLLGRALLAGLTLCVPPGAGEPSRLSDGQAFTYAHGLMFIDGRIGEREVLCLLDTGASLSAVSTSVADELGLEVLGDTDVLGSAGTVQAKIVKLDSLTVGSETVENLRPTKRDIQHGATPGRQLDLIVGYDFLKDLVAVVDFQGKEFRFIADASVNCAWVDMDLRERIPRVAATIDGAHRTWLRVDTGASLFATPEVYVNLTQADLEDLRKLRPQLEPKETLSASGVGGEIQLQVFHLNQLQVGPIRANNPRAIIQPKQGYFALPGAVGFFGNNLLEKHSPVTLDYRHARLGMDCRLKGN